MYTNDREEITTVYAAVPTDGCSSSDNEAQHDVESQAPLLHYLDVVAPTIPISEMPLSQRVFVCLRPQWISYMSQFWTLEEFSGAFGDIGLFLPLATALAIGRVDGLPQLEFGPTLFFAGLFTASLSLYFNIPIPVQPMKTIAAVAIAESYSNREILAAGILMGIILFLGSITRLITYAAKVVPAAIIRGVQLGVGLNVMMKGIDTSYVNVITWRNIDKDGTVLETPRAITSNSKQWFGIDSVIASLFMAAACLASLRKATRTSNKTKVFPVALILFAYGMTVAIYKYVTLRDSMQLPSLQLGPVFQAPVYPTFSEFKSAFFGLVLPQIPLTLLNSVVALEQLAGDLFPMHKEPASTPKICYSLVYGNLAFAWLGMIPVCHGAGGLASQVAFGAKSSLSMVFLGASKMLFALLFGSSCVVLLQTGIFPQSVLGIMLLFSGLSLATAGVKLGAIIYNTKDEQTERDHEEKVLLLLTAAGCLGQNTGVGFLIGMASYCVLKTMRAINV